MASSIPSDIPPCDMSLMLENLGNAAIVIQVVSGLFASTKAGLNVLINQKKGIEIADLCDRELSFIDDKTVEKKLKQQAINVCLLASFHIASAWTFVKTRDIFDHYGIDRLDELNFAMLFLCTTTHTLYLMNWMLRDRKQY